MKNLKAPILRFGGGPLRLIWTAAISRRRDITWSRLPDRLATRAVNDKDASSFGGQPVAHGEHQ